MIGIDIEVAKFIYSNHIGVLWWCRLIKCSALWLIVNDRTDQDPGRCEDFRCYPRGRSCRIRDGGRLGPANGWCCALFHRLEGRICTCHREWDNREIREEGKVRA